MPGLFFEINYCIVIANPDLSGRDNLILLYSNQLPKLFCRFTPQNDDKLRLLIFSKIQFTTASLRESEATEAISAKPRDCFAFGSQ